MKLNKNSTGGFVGILMIFITVTVIIFIMFRTDLFNGKKGSKSMIERDLDAVQQAKDVKALLEKNDTKALEDNKLNQYE